jgi:hypothetical protein
MSHSIEESLGKFIEKSASPYMPDAAAELLELIEGDAVEPLGTPGQQVQAEDLADRLEAKLQQVMRKSDDPPQGVDLLEDAIAHLRTFDGVTLAPFTYEDGAGIRWFVLTDDDKNIVACYTSAPFVEAEQ